MSSNNNDKNQTSMLWWLLDDVKEGALLVEFSVIVKVVSGNQLERRLKTVSKQSS